MSLFVGNISRNVSLQELETQFQHFGACTVCHKGSYAFIQFRDEQDAQDAIAALNTKNLGGLRLNIEWSRRSARFDIAARGPVNTPTCFKCKQQGHISQDCRQAGLLESERRHVSPLRRRSPTPPHSAERSFSLEASLEAEDDDLVFPSDLKASLPAAKLEQTRTQSPT